jgi:hypothetical protein
MTRGLLPAVLAVALLLVAACTRYEARRAVAPSGAACLAALDRQGIAVTAWPAPTEGACRVDAPVVASDGRVHLAPPVRTSCELLVAWVAFEPEIDRLARELRGAGLRRVQHYGSHACRRMTGNRGRLSLHASARAIDIAAFELANGERISVLEHWHARDQRGRFLRAVAQAACARFSAVLTPRTDRAHRDHLHLDLGPWRKCDA